MILENKVVENILDNLSKVEVQSRDTYKIDDKRVPRVTEILSAMLHEESLMSWANSLGWKRIGYRSFLNEAAEKGTFSHLAVLNSVESCLDAFKKWWKKIHLLYKDIEVIYLEETLIHPYFGGTCDCLLKVDGSYWLVDFKTSNHMNYNYSLQLAAYKFLLKELKDIDVEKLIVLKLDKFTSEYCTYELDVKNNDHLEFIKDCEQTFLLLAAAYRMRLYTTEKYYNIYNIENSKKKK